MLGRSGSSGWDGGAVCAKVSHAHPPGTRGLSPRSPWPRSQPLSGETGGRQEPVRASAQGAGRCEIARDDCEEHRRRGSLGRQAPVAGLGACLSLSAAGPVTGVSCHRQQGVHVVNRRIVSAVAAVFGLVAIVLAVCSATV